MVFETYTVKHTDFQNKSCWSSSILKNKSMIHTSFCKVTTCCPTLFPSHALEEWICSYQTWLTLIILPFSNFCLQAACPIYSSSFLRKQVPREVRVSKLSFCSFIRSSILQHMFTDCLHACYQKSLSKPQEVHMHYEIWYILREWLRKKEQEERGKLLSSTKVM